MSARTANAKKQQHWPPTLRDIPATIAPFNKIFPEVRWPVKKDYTTFLHFSHLGKGWSKVLASLNVFSKLATEKFVRNTVLVCRMESLSHLPFETSQLPMPKFSEWSPCKGTARFSASQTNRSLELLYWSHLFNGWSKARACLNVSDRLVTADKSALGTCLLMHSTVIALQVTYLAKHPSFVTMNIWRWQNCQTTQGMNGGFHRFI